VFNTHLDHESALAREKGLDLLYCKIAAISRGHPFLLCGDFNIDECDPLIQKMTNTRDPNIFPIGMVNSKMASATRPLGPEKTFTGWDSKELLTIDYILLKPDMVVQGYSVIDDMGSECRYCSDHRPVQAEILF